jgi:dihydroflavonol-4-reductase
MERSSVILLTGGSGFVGQAVIPALLDRGYRLRLLSRRGPGGRTYPGVDIRSGDLLDPSSLDAVLEGVDTVVHLAAALPVSSMPDDVMYAVNVEGSRNLARAAVRSGVHRFVHGSSGGVYGDGAEASPRSESAPPMPGTPYERTKLEGEAAAVSELSTGGVPWIVLRPSGVHGPGRLATAEFYRQIACRRVWIHGPARVIVHPTYVADVVSAILLALERTGIRDEVFNIAGPEPIEYTQLIASVARQLGVRPVQLHVPGPPVRALARVASTALNLAGRGSVPAIERLRRSTINRSLDTSKARRLLGFQPYPLLSGIEATIAWARAERRL